MRGEPEGSRKWTQNWMRGLRNSEKMLERMRESAEKEFSNAVTDTEREDAASKLTTLERDEARASVKRETIFQRGIAMIDDKTFDNGRYAPARTVELDDAAKEFLDEYRPVLPGPPLALTNGSAPSSHSSCFPPEKGDAESAGAGILKRRRRRRRRGGASICDAPENSEAGSQPPKRDERKDEEAGSTKARKRESENTEAGSQPPKRARKRGEAKEREIVEKPNPKSLQDYCCRRLAQIEGGSEGPDASNIEGDTDAGIRQPMRRTRSEIEGRAVKQQRAGTSANDESAIGGDPRNRGGATTVAAVHNAVICDGDPEYYEGPEAKPRPHRWKGKVESAKARGDAVIATFDVSYVSRGRDDAHDVDECEELKQIVELCRSHDLVCKTIQTRQTTNGQIPTGESEVRNYTLPRFEFPPGIEDCEQFYEFLDLAEAVVEERARLVIFSGADKRKARSAAIAVYVILRARIGWGEHEALRAMRASRSQLLKRALSSPTRTRLPIARRRYTKSGRR